jgi:hypothetical protein
VTYEARKHAQKEAEMEPYTRIDEAAQVAVDLMAGDKNSFKVGYTFANALLGARDWLLLTHGYESISDAAFATLAEKLHEMLS